MLREPFPTSVIEKNAGSCSHSQRSMCVSCDQPRYSEVFLPAFDSELLSQPSLPSVIVFIALPTNEVRLKQQQPSVVPFFAAFKYNEHRSGIHLFVIYIFRII